MTKKLKLPTLKGSPLADKTLTGLDLRLFKVIRTCPEFSSSEMISKRVGISNQQMTESVDRLEKGGHICKLIDDGHTTLLPVIR